MCIVLEYDICLTKNRNENVTQKTREKKYHHHILYGKPHRTTELFDEILLAHLMSLTH